MVKFLQANLRRMRMAHNLALQTARQLETDIMVNSEPARGPSDKVRCFLNVNGTCKVMLTDRANMAAICSTGGTGFVSLSTKEVTVYSCYFYPNITLGEYARLLDGLEADVRRQTTTNLIIAGDFNAKAQEWGSNKRDRRGELLLELAEALGLIIENVGSCPTYQGPHGGA